MAYAQTIIRTIDKSTSPPAPGNMVSGIVVIANKGPIDEPLLCSSVQDFKEKFTPDEKITVGMSSTLYSAKTYLESANSLWVMRATAGDYTFGGAVITQAGKDPGGNAVIDSANFGFGTGQLTPTSTAFLSATSASGSLISSSTSISVTAVPGIAGNITVTLVDGSGDTVPVTAGNEVVSYSSGILTIRIEDGVSTDTQISTAILKDPHILTAVPSAGSTAWILGYSVDSVELSGGTYYGDSAPFIIYAKDPGAWNNDLRVKITIEHPNLTIAASGIDTGTDEIDCGTEEYYTGEGVIVRGLSTADETATGLTNYTTYYVIKDSSVSAKTKIKLAISQANASAGTSIDFISTNAGTFILEPVDKVKESGAFIITVYKASDLVNALETFACKRGTDNLSAKDGFGNNIYIETVLNNSAFIRAFDNVAVSSTVDITAQPIPLAFENGDDGGTVTSGDMITAAQLAFSNENERAISTIMDAGFADENYHAALGTIAYTNRKDCIAVISSRLSDEQNVYYKNKLSDYLTDTLTIDNYKVAIFTPHCNIYDEENDRDVTIAPDGLAAGAMAIAALNESPFAVVAGNTRGNITIKKPYRVFDSTEIEFLDDAGYNCIKNSVKGNKIWGNNTLNRRPTRLKDLHAARLLTIIQPALADAFDDYLYDVNDTATRSEVTSIATNYLTDIKAQRGIAGTIEVICNETNNTQVDFNNDRMNITIIIQPSPIAKEIVFTTVVTSGPTVTELLP
jgi:hypothetical protein